MSNVLRGIAAHAYVILLASLIVASTAASGLNIVLSNDDGWAELGVRILYQSLTDAGNSVVLSAPAFNRSGTNLLDAEPAELKEPCEYNSCPVGSPPYGSNASEPRWNYVNS